MNKTLKQLTLLNNFYKNKHRSSKRNSNNNSKRNSNSNSIKRNSKSKILDKDNINNEEFINKVINKESDSVDLRNQSEIFKKLKMLPVVEQRTNPWYEMRKGMITASSAASLLIRDDTCDPYIEEFGLKDFKKNGRSCNPYSNKREYILRKLNVKSFKGNPATRWGTKYEPVATQIYERWSSSHIDIENYKLEHIKDVIHEFGLIQHPKYSWLGASPDGITEEGIMLEIKCPVSREITGIPPLYYWIQMQLQLEVCDLEICDFIECKIREISKEEYIELPRDMNRKGIIVAVKKNRELEEGEDEYDYIYPAREHIVPENQILWASNKIKRIKEEEGKETFELYWEAEKISIVRVKRSRKWFESVKDRLKEEQENIEKLKRSKSKIEKFVTNGEVEVDLFSLPKNECLIDTDTESE